MRFAKFEKEFKKEKKTSNLSPSPSLSFQPSRSLLPRPVFLFLKLAGRRLPSLSPACGPSSAHTAHQTNPPAQLLPSLFSFSPDC
jgi:hypothetical protein